MLNKSKFLIGLSLILAMSSHSAIADPTQTKETPNRATVIANWFGYSELEYLELAKTSLPSSYEFIAHDGYFGFVPVSVAPTPEKATEYLVSAFEKATEMAIKEHFPDYEIKTFPAFWTDPAEGIGTTKKLVWGVGLVNPKHGCVAPGEPEYKKTIASSNSVLACHRKRWLCRFKLDRPMNNFGWLLKKRSLKKTWNLA